LLSALHIIKSWARNSFILIIIFAVLQIDIAFDCGVNKRMHESITIAAHASTFDASKHKIAWSVKSDYYSVFITVNNASESIKRDIASASQACAQMAASVLARRDINITNQSVSLKRAYTHYYIHSLESSH
jgi:hypothetical protein